MFILSKGKPICNYITEPCKCAGRTSDFRYAHKRLDGSLRLDRHNVTTVKDTKVKSNIWYFSNGKTVKGHPAQFPYQLAYDHIISWSNEGDTVLDIFMGSGTTGIASLQTNRNFIGIELDENYFKIAKDRIESVNNGNLEMINTSAKKIDSDNNRRIKLF
jgi:site-specific DNA-methyltransferase (adenine-specific)